MGEFPVLVTTNTLQTALVLMGPPKNTCSLLWNSSNISVVLCQLFSFLQFMLTEYKSFKNHQCGIPCFYMSCQLSFESQTRNDGSRLKVLNLNMLQSFRRGEKMSFKQQRQAGRCAACHLILVHLLLSHPSKTRRKTGKRSVGLPLA